MARRRLSRPSLSIIVYSIYLGASGVAYAFVPNALLRLIHLPPSNEVWIRLFGLFAILLAVKGVYGALQNLIGLMQIDVITRTFAAAFLVGLVALGLGPRFFLLLAAVDFAASVWTQVGIFAEKRAESSPA